MDLHLRLGTDSGKGSGEGSAETWWQRVPSEEMTKGSCEFFSPQTGRQ